MVCTASWSVVQSGQTVMAGKSSSLKLTLSMVLVLGFWSQSLMININWIFNLGRSYVYAVKMRTERYPTEQDMITIHTSLWRAFSPSTKYLMPWTVDSWITLWVPHQRLPSLSYLEVFFEVMQIHCFYKLIFRLWFILRGPRHTEAISEALQSLKIHHVVVCEASSDIRL